MIIKHRPSHLAQGSVFPFNHAILGRRIWTRKLVLKTQVMAKGFETRVSKFRAIVTADRSYGISVPLVPQPSRQDLKQNQISALSPQERTPTHIESSRPPQQGRTTSHPQIAHELAQQGPYGAARMDAPSSHRCGVDEKQLPS
jgi:hypothetical protein